VRAAGFLVFYDAFYKAELWGKDLPAFFDDIYRVRSRYCVILVSRDYRRRMWTNHERRSAQARALSQRGQEYILPIQVDNTRLPGMPPTTGHLSLRELSLAEVVEILLKKLRAGRSRRRRPRAA
jgi:hypothetical protein